MADTNCHAAAEDAHQSVKVMSILLVTDVVLEVNRFAFMCLDNPGLKRWQIDFQHGPLYGKSGVHDAVSVMQEGKCLLCGGPIEHDHHVGPRSKGGSDTIGNLAGICFACHDKVHKDKEYEKKLKAGINDQQVDVKKIWKTLLKE